MTRSEKRWMMVVYTGLGALMGLCLGAILNLFFGFWLDDSVAMLFLASVVGAIVGFKTGERKLLF